MMLSPISQSVLSRSVVLSYAHLQRSRGLFLYGRMRWHSHGHGGHTHSHNHNEMLVSRRGWSNPGTRITWVGLIANIGMAIGKGVGGVVFHSQSLIADAIHAVSDLISDFLTLATIHYSRRPASKFFPDGYGRIEAMGTFGVGSLLVFAGFSMGASSLVSTLQHLLNNPEWLKYITMLFHSHQHVHSGEMAEWAAAGIAAGSILVKEALYQATYKIGKYENSTVLIANAWHHRVDCFASIVAMLAIAGGQLFNYTWLDPFGGLIVSGMILKAGWAPTRDSFLQLIGSNQEIMKSERLDLFRTKATLMLATINSEYIIKDVVLVPHGTNYVAFIKVWNQSKESTLEEADSLASRLQNDLIAVDPELKHLYVVIGDTTPDE